MRRCSPSGPGRRPCGVDLQSPLRTTEFLAVDTETNGLGGETCELTEVGAVLVGGGELHERWETLVQRRARRCRGDPGVHRDQPGDGRRGAAGRPPRCPSSRSCCTAACWWRTARRSTAACCDRRSSAPGSRGPIRRCCAPSRWRGGCTRSRASASSRRSPPRSASRSRRRIARWPTPRPARASSARCSRSSPPTRRRSAPRSPCCDRSARRGAAGRRPTAAARGAASAAGCRIFSELADTPGVYVARNDAGQVLYVGKSMRVRRAFARTSRRPRRRAAGRPAPRPSSTTATLSELGALVLEQRLVDELRPPGNARLKAADERLAALPPGHPVPGARGRRASRPPATPSTPVRCAGARWPSSSPSS